MGYYIFLMNLAKLIGKEINIHIMEHLVLKSEHKFMNETF